MSMEVQSVLGGLGNEFNVIIRTETIDRFGKCFYSDHYSTANLFACLLLQMDVLVTEL